MAGFESAQARLAAPVVCPALPCSTASARLVVQLRQVFADMEALLTLAELFGLLEPGIDAATEPA